MATADPSPHDRSAARSTGEEELPELEWMRQARAEDELLVELSRQVRRRRRRRAMVAAGTLAIFAMGALLLWPESTANAVLSLPERRTLADGSIVELRDGAQIEIHYDRQLRRVALQRGEAHFQVLKNERPFVVEAAGIKVQAVGTAFAVQLGAAQVEVLVTQGRVQVAPLLTRETPVDGPPPATGFAPGIESPPAFAGEEPILDSGQLAIISLSENTPKIATISEEELAARLAWRIPHLEFSQTPLHEVVALMNRHAAGSHKTRFVVADPELRDVRLSGFLRADNTEGLIVLLENNLSVRVERSGDTIALHRAR